MISRQRNTIKPRSTTATERSIRRTHDQPHRGPLGIVRLAKSKRLCEVSHVPFLDNALAGEEVKRELVSDRRIRISMQAVFIFPHSQNR